MTTKEIKSLYRKVKEKRSKIKRIKKEKSVNMMGRKVDDNHKLIVEALRKYGCSVLSLAALGKGAPDLCVGFCGTNYLLEIKKSKNKKLTPDQINFFSAWRGKVARVDNFEEAINHIHGKS